MSLSGRVCIVTGATRGIGKGIALQLGEAGATVYITGRTLKAKPGSSGSLEDTAKEIEHRGGKCIPVQCDHSNDEDIETLFQRVQEEQNGRLDLLVNNAYAAVKLLMGNVTEKFYELPPSVWDDINNVGLRNHYICTVYASRMMVEQGSGVMAFISSAGALRYAFNVAYSVGKVAVDRMAADCGHELYKKGVSCISLWPGTVRTEHFMEAAETDQYKGMKRIFSGRSMSEALQKAETIEFTGKVIVALMKESDKEKMKRSGKVHIVADIGDQYGIKDINGNRPTSLRSISKLCLMAGYNKLACCFPRWIKLPKWLLTLYGSRF